MTKSTRFHSRWRNDADYLSKLSPEERAYYEKFVDEYYRNDFTHPDLLHSESQQLELYTSQNIANNDVVTQTPDKIAKQLERIRKPKKKNNPHTYYDPSDYIPPTEPKDQ